MGLFHDLVLDVTVELAIGNLVLDCDYAEVVENNVFNIHRDLNLATFSFAKSPSECKIVVVVNSGVPTTFLLVQNQLLGDDLVLVRDLVQLYHELF